MAFCWWAIYTAIMGAFTFTSITRSETNYIEEQVKISATKWSYFVRGIYDEKYESATLHVFKHMTG